MQPDIEKLLLSKIKTLPDLQAEIKNWQQAGQKVVFTNGCFDLVHAGHITYLAKAAQLGNKLIIGLNSDESVTRLKGAGRPVNPEQTRALLLAALFFVDAVVLFTDDTPHKVITTLLPDVLVKGSDYTPENIVGAHEVLAHGGEVKTIDFVNGFSSTSIIQKIKQHPG